MKPNERLWGTPTREEKCEPGRKKECAAGALLRASTSLAVHAVASEALCK